MCGVSCVVVWVACCCCFGWFIVCVVGYICLIWYVGCFPLGLIAMFSGVVMDGLVCFIWVLWLVDFVVAYRFAVRDCGECSGLVCVLDAVVRLGRFWADFGVCCYLFVGLL